MPYKSSKKQAAEPMVPTLSNINYLGRRGLKVVMIGLLALMIGRILWTALVNYWQATHPTPPPPPTVGFGILPSPDFPYQEDDEKPKTYTLEMAGGLTDELDRLAVFLMPRPAANLLADERVKEIAANYGFIFAPEVLNQEIYRFTKNQPLDMSMEINSVDLTFSLRSNYLSKPEILTVQTSQKLPEEFEAVEHIQEFLNAANIVDDDIATVSGQVTFLKSIGGELQTAFSLSDADFVQVDLNRTPVEDKYKMYTPDGETGVVRAVISSAFAGRNSVVEIDCFYHGVDYLSRETYPLRGVHSAWKSVQAGDAYVATGNDLDKAVIREVELAYYDSFEYQQFLQPVYVFRGDDGFLAYVPAISASYLVRE